MENVCLIFIPIENTPYTILWNTPAVSWFLNHSNIFSYCHFHGHTFLVNSLKSKNLMTYGTRTDTWNVITRSNPSILRQLLDSSNLLFPFYCFANDIGISRSFVFCIIRLFFKTVEPLFFASASTSISILKLREKSRSLYTALFLPWPFIHLIIKLKRFFSVQVPSKVVLNYHYSSWLSLYLKLF